MISIPFSEVRGWTFGDALPFWAEHGVDRAHGGFLEDLTLDGAPGPSAFKRVRVLCRQIYVFSHAALLGWSDGERLSRLGYEYLVARASLPGGGWARQLSRSGEVSDARPDLYDCAFVLFALAWRYRLSRERETLNHALETLGFLNRYMRAEEGFVSLLPDDGERLQNPHMHMFEACMAAFEATAHEEFLELARELLSLFRHRLFDGRTLGERFDINWTRAADGRLEPGHHFEWTWILAQFQKLDGGTLTPDALTLTEFAERWGVDRNLHAVYDRISPQGAPLCSTSRIWTNTERLKAWLALFEITGRDPRQHLSETIRLLFDRYFAPAPRGAWIDQIDLHGRPLSKAIPASILYHVFMAFTELMRLEPRLTALDQSRT
jgi:mannose/cellobiose epimerase-like protein (N-acyl-D-glucosamine 2-epimerase family)